MNSHTSESCAASWDLYGSPGSGELLARTEGSLHCEQTGEDYPIRGNIPHFLHYEPAESLQDTETLLQLNRRTCDNGWKAALAETYGDASSMYKYVTDEARALYLALLPISNEKVVLEIGPGLGQFTPLIAAKAKHVYAVEVVSGQATFAAERARQSGISNVTIACGGDDCRLPYKTNSFDLVVVNLVFEWCASRNPAEKAICGQRRLLSEISRVLKPGGLVYLSTKNRYSLQNLMGGPDEHVFDLRFGSVLPHSLVCAWLKLTRRGRPPGLLHSHNKLRGMLTALGLENARSFWAAPEMRYPTHMVSTDTQSVREARRAGLVQGATKRLRLLMPLIPAALVKHLTPGLAFTAQKPFANK